MVSAIRPIVHLERFDFRKDSSFEQILQLFKRGVREVDVLSGPITSGIEGSNNEINFNATTRAANSLGYSSTSTQTVHFGVESARYWTTISA